MDIKINEDNLGHSEDRILSSHIKIVKIYNKSELPRPIPRNSVESDNGCTSGIDFDNAGDNVALTLYNVTLTSKKLCIHPSHDSILELWRTFPNDLITFPL